MSQALHGSRAHRHAALAETGVARALGNLTASTPDLVGALVASVDGLPIAHDIRGADGSGVAAMAATAAGLGKRIVDDFAFGDFAETVVRGSDGYFVVYSVGRVAVLAVIASHGANLGRIHLEARRCATTVATALNGAPY